MKRKVLQQLLRMTKLTLYGIFIQAMLSSMLFAATSKAQMASINDMNVHLQFSNAKIENVFKAIERQTQLNFTYHQRELENTPRISLFIDDESLEEALLQISAQSGLRFKRINDNVHVSKVKKGEAKVQEVVEFYQSINVTGKVTTEEEPNGLPGVNVIIKGTAQGTVTDVDGNYNIVVPSSEAILVFSSVGFVPEEVTVGNTSVIDIVMIPDITSLEEVVVIGYGTQTKGDVTSSVASVKSKDFVKAPVKNAGQLLQGKVAGLTIASSSGDPTSGVQVLLRGNTTILGTNIEPLVLIDGIPGDLNTVAPEDIESIDVLKDGSAAAIYGVRGNNGVIIITTKKVGNKINTLDYSFQLSAQTIARKMDMLSAEDYRQQITDGTRDASWDNGASTDWFDEATQTPFSQIHNLSYRGGNSQTNYLLNFNYRGLEGIFLKSDNKTFNGRIDVTHKMYDDKLEFNLGIIGRQNTFTMTRDGDSFDGWIYRQINIQNPTSPTKNEDGSWFQEGIFDYDNPLARIFESDGRSKHQYTRYNARIKYTPFSGLSLNANMAYDKYNRSRGYSETKQHISTTRDGRNGFASIGNEEGIYRFLELIGEYRKITGDHEFSVLGGYGYQENEWFNSGMTNQDFATDAFGYANIGSGKALEEGNASMWSNRGKTNLISFFGRASYSFKDKYLFLASVRHEAASQLYGAKTPWGTFPAVSIGWRINEESFMSGINSLDILKLRAGYGVTGNSPKDLFLGVATLKYADYFLINGNWIRSLEPEQNPNPYLRWEEKEEYNIGLDYGFLGDRIYGAIDYYIRRIDGLLYSYQVPVPPNLNDHTTANVGIMENKGLEMSMSFVPVKNSDFEWTTQVLFSTNSNKLVTLSNDLYQLETNYFPAGGTGVPIQTHTHLVEIGGKIGNFHGYKVVDITEDGKWIYENVDGEIVDYDNFNRGFEDKKIIGNGVPNYHAGWNNTFRYKNFDLSVTMRGSFDFQIANLQRAYYENTGDERYNRLKSAYDKVFGKAVLNTNIPLEFNSYYVEDGDFWKVDNITLGYNFGNIGSAIRSARVYVSTLNTFIITGYKGIDPEVSWTGLDPGINNRDQYPTTRTFTIGANVSF